MLFGRGMLRRRASAVASTPTVSAASTTCRRCSTTSTHRAKALGLPVRTLMSEYAPGQFEITLEHRADAMRAVDEAILFKRAVRGVAARGTRGLFHGEAVCRTRRVRDAPARQSRRPRWQQRLRGRRLPGRQSSCCVMRLAACASTPRTAGDMAPQRQFVSPVPCRLSYAPVAVTWGINNRSVSLRVPAGPPASRHVEHRVAGADANPYLVAALVLGGMLHGIERQLRPGSAGAGQWLRASTAGLRCPRNGTLRSMQRRRRRSWRDTVGAGFLDVFLAIKRQEAGEISGTRQRS